VLPSPPEFHARERLAYLAVHHAQPAVVPHPNARLQPLDEEVWRANGHLGGCICRAARLPPTTVERPLTVTSTNRGSQLLGSAVGGLLGPLGAVVGGLSGSSRSRGRLRRLTLKIFVDDYAKPVHAISFFRDGSSKGTDPDEPRVRDAREKADRFHAHVLNAMRQAKKQASSGPPTSSASELRTLWEMKQAGALTEEEFVQQKSHLLGKPAARGLE